MFISLGNIDNWKCVSSKNDNLDICEQIPTYYVNLSLHFDKKDRIRQFRTSSIDEYAA